MNPKGRRVPWATLFLATVLATVYVTSEWLGDTTDAAYLLRLGAQEDRHLWNAEIYRIFLSLFVHSGWLGVLMAAFSLLPLGFALEPRIGSVKFAAIYLLSGIAGNLAALCFGPDALTVGCMPAVLGIVAAFALLVFSRYDRYGYFRVRRSYSLSLVLGTLLLLAAGLLLGVGDPARGVSGFLAGAALSYLLMPPEARNPLQMLRKGRVYREPVYLSVESLVRPRTSQRFAEIVREEVRYDPRLSMRRILLVAGLLLALLAGGAYGLHPFLRYDYHLFRADRELARGHFESAFHQYRRIAERYHVEDHPRPTLDYRLAILYADRDLDQEALAHVGRAIDAYERAADPRRAGADHPPFFLDARLWRHARYRELGQDDKAEEEIAYLEERIRRCGEEDCTPTHVRGLWLARVYVESAGDPAQSEASRERLERARELARTSVSEKATAIGLDTMGWSCYRLSRNDEAREALTRASGLAADGSVYFHLALVQWSLLEKEEALDTLALALTAVTWLDARDIVAARHAYDQMRAAAGTP